VAADEEHQPKRIPRNLVATIRRTVVICVALAAWLLSGGTRRNAEQEIPQGSLGYAVEQGRQKGERTVTAMIPWEGGWATTLPLASALRMYSLISVEATGRAVVALEPDYIVTWHVFRTIETISRATQKDDPCGVPLPPSVALRGADVAFPLTGGSMTLKGVTVTVETGENDISFRPGARFVAFVKECDNKVFVLPFGTQGMLPVSSDERIRVNLPKGDLPLYARELVDVGTLDKLRRARPEGAY
jgi:hypothetical protein